MTRPTLPAPERWLLTVLVRGPEAESVLGDIEEGYRLDVAKEGVSWARGRLRRQILTTCLAWWAPAAVAGRRARSRSTGSRATWNGEKGATMASWFQDVRFAVRSLSRRPGFAVGVTLTLGLGIGATTTIYSVVDGVLLRPLAYEEPATLAAVGTTFPTREWADQSAGLQHLAGISMLNFLDFRERTRSFELLAGIEASSSILLPDLGDGPEIVPAASVSSELFQLLGVTPALGRTFLPDEHSTSGSGALMISYGAWQRRFGGDPDVVGGPLRKVGLPVTIVGVLPEDFDPPEALFPRDFDFWMPLQPDHPRYASRGSRSLNLLGRLRSDTGVEVAREEARAIAADIAEEFPDGNVYPNGSWFGIGVNSLHAETVGTAGRALGFFLGAAALLLLLAAMNAATLLLGRALDRTAELGVRTALGAGRDRVARLLMGEALLLAAAAGVVGVALAYGGVAIFLRYAPPDIPRIGGVSVDTRVLVAAGVVSLGAGLLAGLLPAVRSSGGALGTVGGGRRGSSERTSRVRAGLVGAQVSVAVVLLSGATLLLSSFVRIRSVEPGFEPEGLITLNIALKRPDAPPGEETWQAWDLALDGLRAAAGVRSVAGTTNPPFQSPFWGPLLRLPGDPPELRREGIAGYAITPGYLETAGTRLLAGRGIERQDGPDAADVALVNETFVRTQLDGREPIGTVMRHVQDDAERDVRIVGVVEDVVQTRADEGSRPAVYFPYTQHDWPFVQAAVRSDLPPETIVPELRRAVARFSPMVPPRDVQTMADRMSATRISPRFQAMLIGAFAVVALLLAAAGLYGSLAHSVARRRRELGVRMALGAARRGVLTLVFRQGMVPSALGLVVGIGATIALSRVLAGFLYEIEPTDPGALTAVAVVLAVVSVAACIVPARRATTVDPVEALRSE